MKPKPKTTATKTAQTMIECERVTGIPKQLQIAAKRAGCPAFTGQRIRVDQLKRWLRENPGTIKAVAAAAAEKQSESDLKRQKLSISIRHAQLNFDLASGLLIPKAKAESEWATCAAIVQEEAKALMDRDHYRIWIDRIIARLANVSEVAADAAATSPKSSL